MAKSESYLIGFLCGGIRLYQLCSAGFGRHCRFEPSCSRYLEDALRSAGLLRGLRLGAGRLLRCHPWNPGGVDPAPLITKP